MLAAQLVESHCDCRRRCNARRRRERGSGRWQGDVWLPDVGKKISGRCNSVRLAVSSLLRSSGIISIPRTGAVRRHHVDEKRVRESGQDEAAARSGIFKPVSPHTLR